MRNQGRQSLFPSRRRNGSFNRPLLGISCFLSPILILSFMGLRRLPQPSAMPVRGALLQARKFTATSSPLPPHPHFNVSSVTKSAQFQRRPPRRCARRVLWRSIAVPRRTPGAYARISRTRRVPRRGGPGSTARDGRRTSCISSGRTHLPESAPVGPFEAQTHGGRRGCSESCPLFSLPAPSRQFVE